MKQMKLNSKRSLTLSMVLAFLSLFFFSSTSILAEEVQTNITIKQQIQVNHDYSRPNDQFAYIIEPVTDDAPLPQEAKDRYVIYLTGKDERQLVFTYHEPGEYQYRIYQQDNSKVKYVTQDKQVYELHVKVTQTEQGLVTREVMIVNGSQHKTTDMSFTNVYRLPKPVIKEQIGRLPQTGEVVIATTLIGLVALVIGLVLFFYKRREEDDQE